MNAQKCTVASNQKDVSFLCKWKKYRQIVLVQFLSIHGNKSKFEISGHIDGSRYKPSWVIFTDE